MPSTRFRVLQYLPYLAERRIAFRIFAMKPGLKVTGLKKFCNFCHYLRVIAPSWSYDLVFIQKPGFIVNRLIYLRVLFFLNRRVVFDFDDAVFIDRDSGLLQPEALLKKLIFIFRCSRMVIAGNSYLAEFAKKFNTKVEIIPTPVNSDIYCPRQKPMSGQRVTIGWMGTASNLKYLFPLIPVMKQILADSKVRFLIITDLAEKPEQLNFSERIEFKAWQAETEIDDLRLFDIGLMPLADDPYTRGKCGFKLLQYMAVGIPVVASPVGMNCQIVEDGINGFLANSQKEWLDKLRTLCADENLRQRMGMAGRESIKEKFSLQKFSGQWISLLQRIAAEKK
jgi:glycosyltransferase involved in cell wall biosynthesis